MDGLRACQTTFAQQCLYRENRIDDVRFRTRATPSSDPPKAVIFVFIFELHRWAGQPYGACWHGDMSWLRHGSPEEGLKELKNLSKKGSQLASKW
jgi:hypothetical protein